MHVYVHTHMHMHTHVSGQASLGYILGLSLAKFLDVIASVIEQFPSKSFMLQSMSEVN